MTSIIENLHVDCLNSTNSHGAIGWENAELNERYHVWVDIPSLLPKRDAKGRACLHVNSITGDSAHRTRDPETKSNRDQWAEVLSRVRADGLVAKAIEQKTVLEDAERQAAVKHAADHRKKNAGVELHAALVGLMDDLLTYHDETGGLEKVVSEEAFSAAKAALAMCDAPVTPDQH